LDLMVTVDRYGMAHIPAHALREKLAVLLASVGGMR
jgi:hypothetical protein